MGPIRASDRDAYVDLLSDRGIFDQTLRIPFPYHPADADWWIAFAAKETERLGRQVNFALREHGRLIGGCGFNDFTDGTHKSEIGYWIGRSWWGKGITPRAVEALVRYGFEKLGLIRISATIFENNQQSARVLEKCGFVYEGWLKNYYLKDGRTINARLFSRFR
jgi:[ribosomal protein S5]-alanine N-acetyltransferase